MAENPWYPHYVGDYQAKTSHLSLSEHGAYRLLLDYYYSKGRPLPSDHAILYRICRVFEKKERQIIDKILTEFFIKSEENNGCYFNKKCDSEIAKRLKYSKSQSANAQIRHKKNHENIMPNDMPNACQNPARGRVPQPQPQKEETDIGSVSNDSEKKVQRKRSSKKPLEYTTEFLEFFNEYPLNNGSKKSAFDKYLQLINQGFTHEIIIDGAKKYANFVTLAGTAQQFIKHASSWLNQRGWESDYVISAGRAQQNGKPDKSDLARAAADKAFDEMEESGFFGSSGT